MNAIGRAWAIALAGLLAAACSGRTTQSDAGAGHHDATEQDAVPVDAGPRVKDVCEYGGPESPPEDPSYPYSYNCQHEMSDPDCVLYGPMEHDPLFDGATGYLYDCKTPP